MISSTIKGPAFFIFFKTRKDTGGTAKPKRDVISLQIAQALRRRDLEDERARLSELVDSQLPEINQVSVIDSIAMPDFSFIEQRISELEIEIEDLDFEIEIIKKDDALALILIMQLL